VAKINEEARKKYFEIIAPYKKIISGINDKERRLEAVINSNKTGEPYKRLTLINYNLTVVSYEILMNALSVSLLGIKNETILNDARKTCYKTVINLERVFTSLLDVPFTDYEDALKAIASFPELKRYELIRKTGLSITFVKESFGENSRWKWSFVELEARLATVAKNSLNLKTLLQGMDLRSEGHRERIEFFNLTRKMLQKAADEYRLKYEVSTNRMDDFQIAINYLGALRRLSVLLGRQKESIILKRKIELWKDKMEKDQKNRARSSQLKAASPKTD